MSKLNMAKKNDCKLTNVSKDSLGNFVGYIFNHPVIIDGTHIIIGKDSIVAQDKSEAIIETRSNIFQLGNNPWKDKTS